jgi:hypothetical protein
LLTLDVVLFIMVVMFVLVKNIILVSMAILVSLANFVAFSKIMFVDMTEERAPSPPPHSGWGSLQLG